MMKPLLPTGRPVKVKDELISPRPVFKENTLTSLLHQHGLKATSQRLSILKALSSGEKTHLTAREIFEKILTVHSDIGFATVYRFLKSLTKAGIISELKMSHTPARFELKTEKHHHHIICTHCGKIVEFQNEKMEELIQNIIKKHKFSLKHHIIELYGECGKSHCTSTKNT